MRDRLGEEFAGTVTAATSFGLFVQLDTLYVEGLLQHHRTGRRVLPFSTRRARNCAVSAPACANGAGARLRVQVSRVDLDGRKIDFRLVREGQEERLLAKAQRGKAASRRGAGSAVDELAGVKERDAAGQGRPPATAGQHAGPARSAAGARSARGSSKPPSRGGKGR